jgi:predicted DsbA family dithiol-disulfide isomerase
MHDWLFNNQQAWKFRPTAEEIITQAAIEELGFEEQAFTECMASGRFEEEIRQDTDEARQAGAMGTPTFLINGRLFRGYMPWRTFRSVMEQILAEEAQ